MMVWRHVLHSLEQGQSAALVSIVAVAGSSPREVGARMLVTAAGYHGSIGGGALEFQAMAEAQHLLLQDGAFEKTAKHSLGPDLGQCCGGSVTLVTEVISADQLMQVREWAGREAQGPFNIKGRIFNEDFEEVFGDTLRPLLLFGAGHVGRAIVLTLALHPFAIRWVDGRANAFPPSAPGQVEMVQTEDPVAEVETAAPGSFILIMTHSHATDFAITAAALRRSDLGFIGLIGSATKRQRFLSRLKPAGLDVSRLTCPIGSTQIRSKRPAAIALSVAAQLLERDELLRDCAADLTTPPALLSSHSWLVG